jgi:hypothetical protein
MAEDQQQNNDTVFVRVTNRELWESLQSLEKTVQSMDSRMNSILNENVETRSRVRALELKTYTIMAAFGTALLVAAGALVKGGLPG